MSIEEFNEFNHQKKEMCRKITQKIEYSQICSMRQLYAGTGVP